MICGHQINWANACDTNLDDCTGRLNRNTWIVLLLLSTLTLHPPEWMANSEVCTSYDHKNLSTESSCTILAVCYASVASVSFEPLFVVVAFVIDLLFLLQFSIAMVVWLIFYILLTVQTIWIYSDCFRNNLNKFRLF